ncbi:MAG: Eco57I restriction-modification methylase domain-containing protein, partial [Microcystaceae cyanobacterium]
KEFYNELLHIIGLTETKQGSKKLIERKLPQDRDSGSLLESAIAEIETLGKLSRIKFLDNAERFGQTKEEQLFNVALELVITWINRILFLKLLEAQLIRYHGGDRSFGFLNSEKLPRFYLVSQLFFAVLAKKIEDRRPSLQERFPDLPYLNSSLFEPTKLELEMIIISDINGESLAIFHGTVLRDRSGNRVTGTRTSLEYLLEFLDSYDFGSEEKAGIKKVTKSLINAPVLGLIFEKINGYKDGSFFTPGFITMYMCRETIRRAVIQKFNEVKGWNCEAIVDLYNKIDDIVEANQIINSLKICDPAAGSGHFLVSALNEIITIKSELGVLIDEHNKRLKDYHFEVVNDELDIRDQEGNLFEYNPKNSESQRVQKTIFHEKQTLIENCLFGVDINENSVQICRLRLWIELLKNAYYKEESPQPAEESPQPPLERGAMSGGVLKSGAMSSGVLKSGANKRELETLPNIDINIKRGNSLISRFALDSNLEPALRKSKLDVVTYRNAVQTYRNAVSKEQKQEMVTLIETIKGNFKTTLLGTDPNKTKLRQLEGELNILENQTFLIEESKAEKKAREKKIIKLNNEIDKLKVEIETVESGRLYDGALEWRFEFPEVLNDQGDFIGFDVVIGNPPYGVNTSNSNIQFFTTKTDSYQLFTILSSSLLKKEGIISQIIPNSWMS